MNKFFGHMLDNVSSQQLAKAAVLKERIEALQAEFSQILGASSSAPAEPHAPSGRRTMSAAARARIAAAARKRWAKFRGGRSDGAPPAKKRRRRMSPAARAKIAASARARWKKAKAAGKNAL